MKIHLLRAVLFHADGRTDRQVEVTKLIVAFLSSANVPKKEAVEGIWIWRARERIHTHTHKLELLSGAQCLWLSFSGARVSRNTDG
jgi:hypothetical protein